MDNSYSYNHNNNTSSQQNNDEIANILHSAHAGGNVDASNKTEGGGECSVRAVWLCLCVYGSCCGCVVECRH